jgi:hypothetical protein
MNDTKDDPIKWFIDPVRNEKHSNTITKKVHTKKRGMNHVAMHARRRIKLMYRLLINGNLYIWLPSNL